MVVSKVIYGGETLVDLTSDTVTANDLAEGVTATAADGTQITGLLPKVEIDSALSSTSTNPVQNKVINAALDSKVDSSMLSAYLPLAGGTCTGGVSAPNFQTGTGETNYFQCRKFRGEGDANTYYHAVDFGYKDHNSVDFYEYNPNWNFYKCTNGAKTAAVLVGKINENGWNGGAVLSGAPTAPTAAAGTNTTQIATTAFVQTAVSSKVDSADLASVATSGSYNDLSDTPTIPDTSSFAQTSKENTWRSQQTFSEGVVIGGLERYAVYEGSSRVCMPSSSSFLYIPAKGNYTLELSTLASKISRGYSTLVTALITSTGDYTLTINGLDVIRYIGSASDIAIKSTGTLLNILLCGVVIDNTEKVMGVIQATALNES